MHEILSSDYWFHHIVSSKIFHLQVQDSFPFSIGFASDEGPVCTLSNGILFPKGHSFPSMKVLTLHRSSCFNLEAFYTNQNELPPGVSDKISKSTVQFTLPILIETLLFPKLYLGVQDVLYHI